MLELTIEGYESANGLDTNERADIKTDLNRQQSTLYQINETSEDRINSNNQTEREIRQGNIYSSESNIPTNSPTAQNVMSKNYQPSNGENVDLLKSFRKMSNKLNIPIVKHGVKKNDSFLDLIRPYIK